MRATEGARCERHNSKYAPAERGGDEIECGDERNSRPDPERSAEHRRRKRAAPAIIGDFSCGTSAILSANFHRGCVIGGIRTARRMSRGRGPLCAVRSGRARRIGRTCREKSPRAVIEDGMRLGAISARSPRRSRRDLAHTRLNAPVAANFPTSDAPIACDGEA